MLVRVTCKCRKSWFVEDSLAETEVRCKSCGAAVPLPGREPATVSPAAKESTPASPLAAGVPDPRTPAPVVSPASQGDFFLAYQYPPPLWGDKKLYRVYRDRHALLFLHMGLFFDGVDFSGVARGTVPADTALAVLGVGMLVAGAEKIGAKLEAPKLRARLAAVEALIPEERILEARKRGNFLAPVHELTEVRFEPFDGHWRPWAEDPDEKTKAHLRFRLREKRVEVEIRDPQDLRLAVAWLQEMLGPEAVALGFPLEAQVPPAPRTPISWDLRAPASPTPDRPAPTPPDVRPGQ